MIREARVETALHREVKAAGGYSRKLKFPGFNGAPDRLIGNPDTERHWVIELKRPKGPAEEGHQRREHARMRAIGFEVLIIHTLEQVEHFMQEIYCAKRTED